MGHSGIIWGPGRKSAGKFGRETFITDEGEGVNKVERPREGDDLEESATLALMRYGGG